MDIERVAIATARIDRVPSADRFGVLMVAAFEPRKCQEAFIEAMAPVLSRHPEIDVVFCGEGARLDAARALGERLGVAGQLAIAG